MVSGAVAWRKAMAMGGTARVLLVPAIYLCWQATALAAGARVPSCDDFLRYAHHWVGVDENRASVILGLPLRELADKDIDTITKALRRCLAAAATDDDKRLLEQDMKALPSLRGARDQAVREYKALTAERNKVKPELERMAAAVEALPPAPRSRIALSSHRAQLSGIYLRLEEKEVRVKGQGEPVDDFPPYRKALDAIARKETQIAERTHEQLTTMAEAAHRKHASEVANLKLPADDLDKTIVLEGNLAGRDEAWLTLRQWAALLLDNPQNVSVKVADGAPQPGFVVSIKQPQYGPVDLRFRPDGKTLHLVGVGEMGPVLDVQTPGDRRRANMLVQGSVERQNFQKTTE